MIVAASSARSSALSGRTAGASPRLVKSSGSATVPSGPPSQNTGDRPLDDARRESAAAGRPRGGRDASPRRTPKAYWTVPQFAVTVGIPETRTCSPVVFRNLRPPVPQRPVGACDQFVPQLGEKRLDPGGLNRPKRDAVDTRRPVVAASRGRTRRAASPAWPRERTGPKTASPCQPSP